MAYRISYSDYAGNPPSTTPPTPTPAPGSGYRLHYADYANNASGPPDPERWVGPPGPTGPQGPPGPAGPPATSTGLVPSINPITNAPGMAAFPSADIYQSPDSYALTGSMTVRGQPYGYYDTGTLLSLVSTTGPLSSSRAGINGGFEGGVPAIAGYGSFDTVNVYSGIRSEAPPLVLHSVTYDATHVYPHPSLTAAQMQKLRKNMYVMTNSVDTTISTTPAVPNGRKPENHYASYVTGWAADGTSITVVGWTVPGSGHTTAGQVPPVGTLDAGAANATAYFGSPTNMFHANFMAQHNPAGEPDSRTRIYQGIELDFLNYGTTDYDMQAVGIALNCAPVEGSTAKPNAESYGIYMSGFPNGVVVNYSQGGVGLHIEADTAITTQVFNAYRWWSPPVWAGAPVTNLTWESQNYIDSNVLRLQCWASRDTAAGAWPSASVHLGLRIDGTPETMTGGSPMAQIVWNPQGYLGGMQLQNQAGVAALSVDGNGWVFPRVVAAINDAAAAAAGVPIGAMYRNGNAVQVRLV
jgi:hypothetical protein